jgi:hypothetical protein
MVSPIQIISMHVTQHWMRCTSPVQRNVSNNQVCDKRNTLYNTQTNRPVWEGLPGPEWGRLETPTWVDCRNETSMGGTTPVTFLSHHHESSYIPSYAMQLHTLYYSNTVPLGPPPPPPRYDIYIYIYVCIHYGPAPPTRPTTKSNNEIVQHH